MKKINESSLGVLMSFNSFIRQQSDEKRQKMSEIMEELYDELRAELDQKGWMAKGRNNITQTMINNSTWEFKFSKVYSGQEVVVALKGNIKDDYISAGGYNTIKVTKLDKKTNLPEVPEIIRNQPFDWRPESRISLYSLLDKIDAHFSV